MLDMKKSLRVAAVQAAPVLFDKTASAEKAVKLISDAAENGAELVVFPEAFIPCYPKGLSFGINFGGAGTPSKKDYLRFYDNSVLLPGPELSLLCDAARRGKCWVSIGVSERDAVTGTLYCTNVFIDSEGRYAGKHRKIKPTAFERCIWGEGGADTMKAVDTPFGPIGSLICWENYMPLARVAMFEQGVTVYIAPTADSRKEWQATVKHIAQEGRCFVISCNQFVTRGMYPRDLDCLSDLSSAIEEISPGGTCVVAPSGKYIAQPVYHKEETLICDLDLSSLAPLKLDFDVCGHYSRPDLFDFRVKG